MIPSRTLTGTFPCIALLVLLLLFNSFLIMGKEGVAEDPFDVQRIEDSDMSYSRGSFPLQAPPIYAESKEAARIIDLAMSAAKEYMQKAFTENITESMVIDVIRETILDNGGGPLCLRLLVGKHRP